MTTRQMLPTIRPAGNGRRVPVHVWSRRVRPEALALLDRLASQPYVVEHIAAMPDVHLANGVCVGTVFATEHHVVPAALGGDLGCGMRAVRFDFAADSLDRSALRRVLAALAAVIPTGNAGRRELDTPAPDELLSPPLSTQSLCHERDRLAPRHFGTLGGGNHFVELDRDASGFLWLVVHTGSRGLGAAINAHHARAAQSVGADPLASLDVRTEPGRAFMHDAGWAFGFARANRERIAARVAGVLAEEIGARPDGESVDVHHNFVADESHFGRTLLVHRKGATPALRDRLGIIPGSMGTATYIVRGLGNPDSFCSCAHGAGRVLSRAEARRSIRRDALKHAMRRVVFDERLTAHLVEEAPQAYRDIREVMEDQEELVEPVLRLEPLAVLKG